MGLEEAHRRLTYNNPFLKLTSRTNDLLQDIFFKLDRILFETHGSAHEWLELFYWRERGLVWGMDLQSVYSPIRHAWMPLFDRNLLILCRNLTVEQKKSGHFLIDVCSMIVPALEGVKCSTYSTLDRIRLTDRIKQRAIAELHHYMKRFGGSLHYKDRGQESADQTLAGFWELVFLNTTGHIWREFISEGDLRKLIRVSPQNDLLWRLITIELLAETYF